MSGRHSSDNLIAGAGIGVGLLAYASLIEPFAVEHITQELHCPRLPLEFDGYRVLLLSDFHSRKFGVRERRVLKLAKKAGPHDLIAICGDLVHTPEGVPGMAEFVSKLSAPDGIVVTFGNSEHKNGVIPHELARELTDAGATMLLNKSIRVSRGDSSICVAGVDDPVSGHDDIHAAFDGVPSDRFKLMLMHTPDNIGQAATLRVDVVLSGHTHGGQVKLPIIGAAYTHSRFGRRMNHGLYRQERLKPILGYSPGHTQLYITRGIGISGLALRFLCRPEITTIVLKRSAD